MIHNKNVFINNLFRLTITVFMATTVLSQQVCTDFPISVSNFSTCVNNKCFYNQHASSQISLQPGLSSCYKFQDFTNTSNQQTITITPISVTAIHALTNCYYTDDPLFISNFVGICGYNIITSSYCPSVAPHTPFIDSDVCLSLQTGVSDCFLGASCTATGWVSPSVLSRFYVCEFNSAPSFEILVDISDTFDNTTHSLLINPTGTVFGDTSNDFNLTFGIPTYTHSDTFNMFIYDVLADKEFFSDKSRINVKNEQSVNKFGYFQLNSTGSVIIPPNSKNAYSLDVMSCRNDVIQLRYLGPSLQDVVGMQMVRVIESFELSRGIMWEIGGIIATCGYDMNEKPSLFPISGYNIVVDFPLTNNVSLCYIECNNYMEVDFPGGFVAPCIMYCPDFNDIVWCNDAAHCSYNVSGLGIPTFTIPMLLFPLNVADTTAYVDIREITSKPVFRANSLQRNVLPSTFTENLLFSSVLMDIQYNGLSIEFDTISATPFIWELKSTSEILEFTASTLDIKSPCLFSTTPGLISPSQINLDISKSTYKFPVSSTYKGNLTLYISCGIKNTNKTTIVDFNKIDVPSNISKSISNLFNPASNQPFWANYLKMFIYVSIGTGLVFIAYKIYRKRSKSNIVADNINYQDMKKLITNSSQNLRRRSVKGYN